MDDQEKELRFYTTVLGFVKDKDIPISPFRWLTVNSPEGAQGGGTGSSAVGFPPAQTYQKALFDAGIPATAFLTEDIQAEFARFKERGVIFDGEPKKRWAQLFLWFFEDICGNLINLAQPLL